MDVMFAGSTLKKVTVVQWPGAIAGWPNAWNMESKKKYRTRFYYLNKTPSGITNCILGGFGQY